MMEHFAVAKQTDQTLKSANQMHKARRYPEAEQLYRKFLKRNPNHGPTLGNLAIVLQQMGKFEEAMPLLERSVRIRPSDIKTHNALCQGYQMLGKWDDVYRCATDAIRSLPNSGIGHFHLGKLYTATMNPTQAVQILEEGISIVGQEPNLLRILGDAYTQVGRYDAAIETCQTLIKLKPNVPDLHCDLGLALQQNGDLEASLDSFKSALQIDSNHLRSVAGHIEILVSLRRVDEARTIAENAIQSGKHNPEIAIAYARICLNTNTPMPAINHINTMLNQPRGAAQQPRSRSQLYLMLGSLKEKQGEYDDAFSAYDEGNKLYDNTLSDEAILSSVEHILDGFTPDKIAAYTSSVNSSMLPVFVVGMPRSGTSLIEQILASHPQVIPGGERREIQEIALEIEKLTNSEPGTFPDAIASLSCDQMQTIAEKHISYIQKIAGDSIRFVDKTPANYMLLGLIALLFPNAIIINSVRDPVDTCFSCFATRLGPSHTYANSLHTLGIVYRCYERMMDIWKDRLNLSILDVRYETLVTDTENQIKRLLDFCDLPFDESCLRFFESKHSTPTSSRDQVTQPVYTSSVGRHKHFADHIEPLTNALQFNTPF